MKLKTGLIVLLSFVIWLPSKAENPARLHIGVEFGGNEPNTTLNEKWNIRQDVGSYYFDANYSANSVSTGMHITHFAVKPEISLFDGKVAFSSGLRFSNILSDINVNGNKGFFYLRYYSVGMNTEYAKVKAINESSNYLGVPFELKIVPIRFWEIDFYFKTGIELNYLLGSKTRIDFVAEEMKESEQTIIDNVGLKVNNLYSAWSNAIGASFGAGNKLRYNVEFLLPSFFITKNNSTIVNTDMFTGFRCSIQLPVKQTNVNNQIK
jgi:hypothetical protein